MGIEDFITDAHYKPNDYIAYHVGRELAELHPGKAVIQGYHYYFELESFAHAGHCSVVEHKSIFHHVKTQWEGVGKKLDETIENSWLHVLWQGHLMDVVLMTWYDGRCRVRHHWIVAEERKIAEDFFRAVCDWCCEVRGEILVFHDGYFQKDKQLFSSIKNATFENLILPYSLMQQVQNDFQQFFDSREIYERYAIPWKRGALFIGPPGNGKTHTLKALVNQLAKPCLYIRSFKTDDETEQENISEVFKRARMMSPCVLVLEDLDSMIHSENRSFFLNELDGFQSNNGVVVLATTNHPEQLDPSILDRPSRFDRKYYFELPRENERRAYVAKWNQELQLEMRVTERGAEAVVKGTAGFSFAYLKELFVTAMVQWITSGGNGSMDRVIMSQAELLRSQMNQTAAK
ncbi:MAG TPA: AAA family ATPase [Pyrinomonadaceae bacterium]